MFKNGGKYLMIFLQSLISFGVFHYFSGKITFYTGSAVDLWNNEHIDD
jgi:hypothetical protein